MILKNINHPYAYHTQKMATMFFPLEKIQSDGESDIVVITAIENEIMTVTARVYSKEHTLSAVLPSDDDAAYALSRLMYRVLGEVTQFYPPWGVLFGVRPARLMHSLTERLGVEGAKKEFEKNLVQPDKVALAVSVMENENRVIALSKDNSFSLYVSIPFCPSRCSYCSFVSHSIENAKDLIAPYVERLCEELKETARIAKALHLRLETIYFGGGTPTTLSAAQLDAVLGVIEEHFDLSTLREYTVEAGRPDTVTEEKLQTLLSHRVGRISINPQTFSDTVLQNIGRRHTVEQTLQAFRLARSLGFDNINMDLIAGLGGDTLPSFEHSVDSAIALGADSITVHNLALKSASFLATENEYYDLGEKNTVASMVNYSAAALRGGGYVPYYMYRQSKSLGNLENVGWCKEGKECLYNVFMMDETHTVLAAGAGAVTKLKRISDGHIERIYNYKYPYEYLANFDEVLRRKEGILSFYRA